VARYISKYSSMKKTVRKATHTLIQGQNGPVLHEVSAPHIAFFRPVGITPWERDFAVTHFGFKGVADGEDPLKRISSYDTDEEAKRLNWSDEEKAAVEKMLDDGQNADYFRIERPRLPAPWPKYDELVPQGRRTIELVAAQIAETVRTLGLDPQTVAAYERENLNREIVIAELEANVETLVEA